MENRQPPLRAAVLFLSIVLCSSGLAAQKPKPTLLDLGKKHFASRVLSEAEETLLIATEKGEPASMLSKDQQKNDPSLAATWPASRAVQAEVLLWLCTNADAAAYITRLGLRISGMRIEGDLDLSEAKLDFSIEASKCAFDGNIFLSGARMRWLILNGSVINRLEARRTEIGADFFLADGLVAKGLIDLSSANISGDLNCADSRFVALLAEQANIGGAVLLRRSSFESVNFLAATLGESLDCGGAHLKNPRAVALLAERATIAGNVFLRLDPASPPPEPNASIPFRAEGQINLLAAKIHGSLECDGALLTDPPPEGALLLADRTKITGHIFLRRGFRCDGLADFSSSEASYLLWAGVEKTDNTVINLQSAKFGGVWTNDLDWVRPTNLILDGFVYSRMFGRAEEAPKELFKWLALQSEDRFHPQPYDQLAAVLKSMGQEREARDVMLAKNRQHRKFTQPPAPDWWWYGVFGRLIGYGYLPSRAFWISIVLIVIGACLFKLGYWSGIVEPTKESAYEKKEGVAQTTVSSQRPTAESYPRFNAFVYSLESFTPLLRLDQSSNWGPNPNSGTRLHRTRFKWLTTGSLLRLYLWIHIILGWILTSLWVGSITGLVKT